jgi:hypothetical protein
MGRHSPQKAFDELVRASQQHNIRLVEIAAAVSQWWPGRAWTTGYAASSPWSGRA